MNSLKAIIVDDERLARRGLALRLERMPQVEVVAKCANGEQGLRAITEHAPDLVFLDIQMPGMSGFEMLRRVQSDTMPMVIFTTAYDQYAVEAFKVHAVDYLLKPIEEERLQEAVERAVIHHRQQASEHGKEKLMELVMGLTGASPGSVEAMAAGSPASGKWPKKITIRDGGEIRLIKVTDIEWIDAAGDYMCIHAGGATHIMRTTMKQLEALLNPAQFLRIHRSTIVNAAGVTAAQPLNNGEYLLTLDSHTQLKVSRGYRDRVKQLLAGS